MKQLAYIITLTLVLVSCGSRSGYFSIDGRLLNLNQGEFYVYSTDGVFDGIDTIKVEGGRFVFETPCKQEGTIVIVFPNFSEQPVFAKPGKKVTVKGDASHLKEIEVEGTDDNELMNSFRQQIAKASPPEVSECAERFIKNNAGSPVSVYILKKYFANNTFTDYAKASMLAETINKAQPKNGEAARITRYLKMMKRTRSDGRMPSFSEKDISGNNVTDAALRGRTAVVYAWAGWEYRSTGLISRINRIARESGGRLAVLGVCLDASVQNCKNTLRTDSVSHPTICDRMMFDSPMLERFALGRPGDNIIYNAHGKAVAHGLSAEELEIKLKSLLNL